MLSQILSLAIASGTAELRRLRMRAILLLLSVAALLVALGLMLVALSLWLTLHMAPWQAALLAALAAVLVAAVLVIAGRSVGRRQPRADTTVQIQALLDDILKEGEGMTPMARVTAAVAAGVVIGRMLSR
jgi:membrane protein implicated in regulation of membrane protease activity